MADLTNITTLSGLTIASDQIVGTNNINATLTVPNVTKDQRDALENVTPYEVDGIIVKVKNGTLIYNITDKTFQFFIEGKWVSVVLPVNDASGIGLASLPFSVPSGENANVEVEANEKNGFLYNDTTNNVVRGYINNTWMTLFSGEVAASGVGLTVGSPFSVPSGPRENVEVAANAKNGFLYYDSIIQTFRVYSDSHWMTLNSNITEGSGAGLGGRPPFLFPKGTNLSVEVPSNEIDGFTYYDTTNAILRVFARAWKDV